MKIEITEKKIGNISAYFMHCGEGSGALNFVCETPEDLIRDIEMVIAGTFAFNLQSIKDANAVQRRWDEYETEVRKRCGSLKKKIDDELTK